MMSLTHGIEKGQIHKNRTTMVTRACGLGEMGRCRSKGMNFQLQDMFWGSNVQHSDYS